MLRNEIDNKEQIRVEEQEKMCKDLKADVDSKNAPILDEIHGIKTDMNTMKMNIIATGQLEAGFSTEQGLKLTSKVASLTTRFDTLLSDQQNQFASVSNEAQNKITKAMEEKQMVLDDMIRDISSLQSETEKLKESTALEELENHLTERITMLSENSLDMNATQRESYRVLSEKIEAQLKKVKENKKKLRKQMTDVTEEIDVKMKTMGTAVQETTIEQIDGKLKQLEL